MKQKEKQQLFFFNPNDFSSTLQQPIFETKCLTNRHSFDKQTLFPQVTLLQADRLLHQAGQPSEASIQPGTKLKTCTKTIFANLFAACESSSNLFC
jgi:hypothetical protein